MQEKKSRSLITKQYTDPVQDTHSKHSSGRQHATDLVLKWMAKWWKETANHLNQPPETICFPASTPAHEYHPEGTGKQQKEQQQQQQSASPSYPVSTAWDSRSSRRTNLPPCQREPASLPAALVHSREAVDYPAVITQHWQRDTELRVRRGWGGSPRLCSWAHLWISVTPLSSPSHSAFLLSQFCYDLIVSCLAPPPVAHAPAIYFHHHRQTPTHPLPFTLHPHPQLSSVNSSFPTQQSYF